jgi:DNA-binding transcriptional MerR regulator
MPPEETNIDPNTPAPLAAPAAPAVAPVAAPAAPRAAAPVVRVPQDKFKERVDRAAEQRIQKTLGVSLEEAKRLLRRQNRRAARGADPSAPVETAGEREASRVERLEEKNRRLREEKEQIKKKLLRTRQRGRDRIVEMTIRTAAIAAGITEDNADFAVSLYQRELLNPESPYAKALATPTAGVDERAFFAGLRGPRPYLFSAPLAAPVMVPVAPASAAPESTVPGGGPSREVPPAPPPAVNVDEMSEADFKIHRQRNYGFGG